MTKISFIDYIRSINDTPNDASDIYGGVDFPEVNSQSSDRVCLPLIEPNEISTRIENILEPLESGSQVETSKKRAHDADCMSPETYYRLVRCPQCEAMLPLRIPPKLRIPRFLESVIACVDDDFISQFKVAGRCPINLVSLIEFDAILESNSSSNSGLMNLFSQGDSTQFVNQIQKFGKNTPCHPAWLHLLSSLSYSRSNMLDHAIDSYRKFLNTFPAMSPSIGLLIHWNKYACARSPRESTHELGEMRRYRHLMFGHIPRTPTDCICCGKPREPS